MSGSIFQKRSIPLPWAKSRIMVMYWQPEAGEVHFKKIFSSNSFLNFWFRVLTSSQGHFAKVCSAILWYMTALNGVCIYFPGLDIVPRAQALIQSLKDSESQGRTQSPHSNDDSLNPVKLDLTNDSPFDRRKKFTIPHCCLCVSTRNFLLVLETSRNSSSSSRILLYHRSGIGTLTIELMLSYC